MLSTKGNYKSYSFAATLALAAVVLSTGRLVHADTNPWLTPSRGQSSRFAQVLAAGRTSAAAKHWQAAEHYFLQAYRIAPERPDVLLYMGLSESHRAGHQWQAIAWLRAFLATQPDAATADQVRREITRLAAAAHHQAKLLLGQLRQLAALLPGAPLKANARQELQTDSQLLKKLSSMPPRGHRRKVSPLARVWQWAFVARGIRDPELRAAAARPLVKNQRAWEVFARQEQILYHWIHHLGMVQRDMPISESRRRYFASYALRFYLEHVKAALALRHFRRAWAAAKNILILDPTAQDMAMAVHLTEMYPLMPETNLALTGEWYPNQTARALYLPLNVGLDFASRYNHRAAVKIAFGLYGAAVDDYRRVIAIYATVVDKNFRYDAHTGNRLARSMVLEYILLGGALYHGQQYAKARTAYARALMLAPTNSVALAGLHKIKTRLALRESLAAETRFIHQRIDLPRNYARRANLRERVGDVAGALADCSRVIALDPKNISVRQMRMNLEAELGKNQAAIADGTALLNMNYPDPLRVYRTRAQCLRRLGNWPKANADYTAIIHIAPWEISARIGRMEAEVHTHDYGAATGDALAIIAYRAPATEYRQAVRVLHAAALAGSRKAMTALGRLYAWGKVSLPDYLQFRGTPLFGAAPTRPGSVAMDPVKAIKWFKKAAAAGSGDAMAAMGGIYFEGLGIGGGQHYRAAMQWFRRAAAAGCGDAMAAIGWLYADGFGVPRNDQTAMRWFRRGVATGSGRAMLAAGWFREHGRAGRIHDKKALHWYKKAYAVGCADAADCIGNLYQRGKGVRKNASTAVLWFRRAAAAGSASGYQDLGLAYQNGTGVRKSSAKAMEYLTMSGATNYVDGCFKIACDYFAGDDLKKRDYAKAAEWFRIAARFGDPRAMNDIGTLYHFGQGLPQDDMKAVAWYRKAARAGDLNAMDNLALAFRRAHGVPLDYRRAMFWWKMAAHLGSKEAAAWIGNMYFDGHAQAFTYTPNYHGALRWWKQAAKQGSRQAMQNLSLLYWNGWGVTASHFMAEKWRSRTGDVRAMYKLGNYYQLGRGTAKNPAKAVACFRQAADSGSPDAMNLLAVDYMAGYGIVKNNTHALKWFAKAAAAGSTDAMCWLGQIYEQGKIVPRNFALAMDWYRKAMRAGSPTACCSLGVMYAWGEGVSSDYRTAVEYWRKGAAKGSKTCMGWMAHCYEYGLGVAKDPTKATLWQARAGDTGSENNIGYDYYVGKGLPQNYKLAVHWFRKAAYAGDANAMNNMGYCYLRGNGVSAWDYKAIEWFSEAAKKGNRNAMLNMGELYGQAKIDGVAIAYSKIDITKALVWYRKAAALGSANAAIDIAVIYLKGDGVMEDDPQAVRWFRKAATEGSVNAMNWLVWCYQNGRGVPQDHNKAMKWQRKAQATAAK
ncbi:MAG: hypothetical protein HKL95_10425 [Phycisphaerae bacterium]|nr:hypothetical protein [Phycisphaerae bacterium]